MRTNVQGLTAALILFVLTGCSTTPPSPESRSHSPARPAHYFPAPEGLEPQIDFWRKVYAVWSLNQVILHDDEHLNLVYEIVELPNVDGNEYTRAKRRLVRDHREDLAFRLRTLENRIGMGAPLNAQEQALAKRITTLAGAQAITGASTRLRSQRGLRERFKRGLEISGRYDGLFRQIFREAGLPEDIAYLPHVESSFQSHAHSSAGAVGMWQFTRPAARIYMRNHPALDERLDPVASARGAARYLADAYGKLGNWALALTSYNHGIGGMQRAQAFYGHDFMRIVNDYEHRYFGFASRNFYAEFLAARDIARHPDRFFPEGLRYEPPLNWDRIVLTYSMPISELALRYNVDRGSLATMNAAWTHAARRGQVAIPAGTEVWLPPGTVHRVAQLGRLTDQAVAVSNNIPASQKSSEPNLQSF